MGSNVHLLPDQLIENKQKFISQIMTSKQPERTCEDLDGAALSYAEVKALASGNPEIKEMMDLEVEVGRLRLLKRNYQNEIYRMEDKLQNIPQEIQRIEAECRNLENDFQTVKQNQHPEGFQMQVDGVMYSKKNLAGEAILAFCKGQDLNIQQQFGLYCGLELWVQYDAFNQCYQALLKGSGTYRIELGSDALGNITRIGNELERLPVYQVQKKDLIRTLQSQAQEIEKKRKNPFAQEEVLQQKEVRLHELEAKLKIEENAVPIEEKQEVAIEKAQTVSKNKEYIR